MSLLEGGERSELAAALAKSKSALIGVVVLSAVLNVLLLGGSIYMMLLYDSVLPSQSIPTLVGLLMLIVVVYVFQGIFDVYRARILSDVGASLDLRLTGRVQSGVALVALRGRTAGDGLTPMRDLDQVRNFLSGPGPGAMIDLPWILFFLAVLFLLHVWLGVTALIGAIVLVILTVLTDRLSRAPTQRLTTVGGARNAMAESNRRHVEIVHALGMQRRVRDRWEQMNRAFLASQQGLSNSSSALGGISKVFRLFIQSMVLTVGVLLVIGQEATPGVIFASSIIAARALAPVDQAIAQWRGFTAARQGWKRLNLLLAQTPDDQGVTTILPPPVKEVRAERMTMVPPGSQRVAVQDVSFTLNAGDALGIVGPSASGKSSLVRGLTGVWLPARGTVRIDGATLDQWDPEMLGSHMGYLPQQVALLDGTVAENIARFEPQPSSEAIIAAAQAAGIHEMILRLPDGYETQVGVEGNELSAGQRQRVALARALYGDPFFVILDEPNSNLDADGEAALDRAIAGVRARGGIVIIVAHRPAALAQVNYVLFLRNGVAEAFGPRDEVLAKILNKRAPSLDKASPQQLKQREA